MKLPLPDGPFDLGIEEEYQLVDPQSWELRSTIQAILEKDLEDGVEDVRAEFLQSQMEAGTRTCNTVQELRVEVRRIRDEAAALAEELGLAVVAAGTHPFSHWTEQQVTRGDRYAVLAEELQQVGRRLVTFGLHVHIGVAEPDRRIELMNRMRPYLPLLLALSTSSPFLEGQFTGLRSYRSALLAALPRTGIPPAFESWAAYRSMVELLIRAGLLADPGFIWWDARPNHRFPTLEIRIHDMPTRIEETVCLAAWAQALAVKLLREPAAPPMRRFVVEANKWEVTRRGLEAELLLSSEQPARRLEEWVERLLEELTGVAQELGSEAELAYARTILAQGTSADRQLRVWEEKQDLHALVEHLARETLA